MTARRSRETGMVLLAVLWAVALLALLGTAVTGTARREVGLGIVLRHAALAHAAAEAALHQTMYDLLTGRRMADGLVRQLVLDGAVAEVRVGLENGKLNPNTAPVELLAGLLRLVGADGPQASAVASAVVAWRGTPEAEVLDAYRAAGRRHGPAGGAFRSLEELRLVMGMTPALYAAAAPHLSVYQEGVLDAGTADPVVREAMAFAGIAEAAPGGVLTAEPSTVSIGVRATTSAGGVAAITAVVRLDPTDARRPSTILFWDEPADGG